ncbi:hypothetical protein ONV75_15695 [Clostridium sp. LQ25]|uniref:hypothetical protein n=1 Tax=Clostridium sp. LQ25 TaxID=2992805 RepID=UPI002253A12B|nr:hypothetical protein [Clostridium sp. LQ25]UZT06026.1 hypothetical protein ONV75_15695 [Clostridium sp. LQ25]
MIRKITGDIIYASIILIFAFISSTILFSAVPETFSFGTLSLVLMYYVGYKIMKAPYDMQNAGVKEADNLDQALYMISLVSDKNHPLVD